MSPLFGTSAVRTRAPRDPAGPPARDGIGAFVLPWLSAALAWVVGRWVLNVVFGVLAGDGASAAAGLAIGALTLGYVAVTAAVGLAVLRRSMVRRGPLTWLAAGLPVPVVAMLFSVGSAALSPGAQAAGAQPIGALVAAVLGLLAAFIGAMTTGALRARGKGPRGA